MTTQAHAGSSPDLLSSIMGVTVRNEEKGRASLQSVASQALTMSVVYTTAGSGTCIQHSRKLLVFELSDLG